MSAIKEQECEAVKLDDCWNRIGVWSNEKPRCPKLDEVIHCANCTIYSSTGRKLLDRSADKEYLENWRIQLKELVTKPQHDFMSVLVFRIAHEWMALSTRYLKEVVEMRVIHRMPHSKSSVIKGLVNVRGELHVCVSLGALLGVEKRSGVSDKDDKGKYIRLVVVLINDIRFVFPVSEVRGILRYTLGDVQNVPATAGHGVANYMQGLLVQDNVHIGCIDENLLVAAFKRALS